MKIFRVEKKDNKTKYKIFGLTIYKIVYKKEHKKSYLIFK